MDATPDDPVPLVEGIAPQIEPERLQEAPQKEPVLFAVDLDAMPPIDVSVVTFKSRRWFASFFASLEAQNYPLEKINLILTDHTPDDSEIEALVDAVLPFQTRLASCSIEHRENRGFGAGHNRALTAGNSEFVLVTNIDLSFEPDTLTRLVSTAVSGPADIGSWECRQKPYEHPKAYDIITQTTKWSSAACLLLRRKAFADVKGFDEKIFMYGEDVDLSGRLRARGWKLRYCPRAVVWHYSYASANEVKETQYFQGALGNMYLRLRYGSLWDIAAGLAMQAALLVHRQRFPGKTGKLLRNYGAIATHGWHFLASRARKGRPFSFRNWDYVPQRHGAFVAAATDELPERPPVTLVIRTYPGRLPLLREAIHSAGLQTYRPLELVVVEDGGSTAAEFCARLSETSDLDIIYYSAPRRGRCYTGNVGLALARGKYIGFLDDDDLLFADHVETMVEALLAGRAHLVYGHAWDVETKFACDNWVPYREKRPQARLAQSFDRVRLWQENYIPIQAALFDRILYETYGGFAEELENLEDWDLWQRYALAGDFETVEKTTSLYRTPADPEVRRRRMRMIHDYYPRVTARQDQMQWCTTVGDLRRATGGDRIAKRNRLAERLAKYPALYALARWGRRLF